MKKLLVAGIAAAVFCSAPALAAEMPVKAPVYNVPAPLFSWAGFYVGGTAGYAWGSYTEFAVAGGDGPNVDIKGFVGGATWGTNWQVNNWVFGFESDFSNGPRGSDPVGTPRPNFSCNTGRCVVDVNYFSTSRVRLGVTSNRWLLYATGGLAVGRIVGGGG
jgi:outer membrane immunogenic protein